MKVYWGFKDVPELANLSRHQRREVLRACWRQFLYRQWLFWVGFTLIYFLGFVGAVIGLILQDKFGVSDWVGYACSVAGAIIGGLACKLIFYTILIERFRPHLREYLAAHPVSG